MERSTCVGRYFLLRDCHKQASLLPQLTLARSIWFSDFFFLSFPVLLIHLNSLSLCKNTQHAMAASESIQTWLPSPKTIAFAVAVVKSRPPELSIGGTYNPPQQAFLRIRAPLLTTMSHQSTSVCYDSISPRASDPMPSAPSTIIWTGLHSGSRNSGGCRTGRGIWKMKTRI